MAREKGKERAVQVTAGGGAVGWELKKGEWRDHL